MAKKNSGQLSMDDVVLEKILPAIKEPKVVKSKPQKKHIKTNPSKVLETKTDVNPKSVDLGVPALENVTAKEKSVDLPSKDTDKENIKNESAIILKNKKLRKQKNIKPVDSEKDKEPKPRISIFKRKAKIEEVKPIRVRRIKADPLLGLTSEQAEDRTKKGHNNVSVNTNVKTYKSIFYENICSFFNLLCLAIAISLLCVGAYKDTIFMLIIIANISVGIFQEIRAKITIEKLSLLTAPVVDVMRDGTLKQISTKEVVLDDIIKLTLGKQIVADLIIVSGNIEVNESLLTGESLPIKKKVGDSILSGSFVVSGECFARVDKVGSNCYIEQLASKAKKYKRPKSELFTSLSKMIKIIGFVIIPIGIAMYINNYIQTDNNIALTVTKTAGSIIGMIPAGMFLLCSVTLAVSVIKLAKKRALVQDLYCVEMLARVNVLCLDKTGTITDGTMKVYNCLEINNNSEYTLKRIIGSMLNALSDNNQTSQALINYFGYSKELKPISTLPFSSSRKLSAVTFEEAGTYILGAAEFVIPNLNDSLLKNKIDQYSKDGYRVLLLAKADGAIKNQELPSSRTAVAILVLEDKIRDDAVATIKWFKDNNVDVKIISGDNPLTVAEIAKRVGVANTDKFINLEGMNEKQVISVANSYTVFGRVTPEQKAVLIKAIKAAGNTVAMTGDGVNDILALKEADCSIAMANGSEAVRSVSHMVLLDSQFSSMPETVIEGRRVINNVQTASSLFFMKTIFTVVFSLLIILTGQSYPFSPMQLILLEYFVIGIPSFFLAFRSNTNKVSGKFIYNLIKNALPAGITLILNVCAVYLFANLTGSTDLHTISTMATLVLTFTGVAMLYRLCKPFTVLTGILFASMSLICLVLVLAIPTFFNLVSIGLTNTLFVIILIMVAPVIIELIHRLIDSFKEKEN
ncbi:MAG: HAD-IC family P-type ATPase [Clostridia bacterium]